MNSGVWCVIINRVAIYLITILVLVYINYNTNSKYYYF